MGDDGRIWTAAALAMLSVSAAVRAGSGVRLGPLFPSSLRFDRIWIRGQPQITQIWAPGTGPPNHPAIQLPMPGFFVGDPPGHNLLPRVTETTLEKALQDGPVYLRTDEDDHSVGAIDQPTIGEVVAEAKRQRRLESFSSGPLPGGRVPFSLHMIFWTPGAGLPPVRKGSESRIGSRTPTAASVGGGGATRPRVASDPGSAVRLGPLFPAPSVRKKTKDGWFFAKSRLNWKRPDGAIYRILGHLKQGPFLLRFIPMEARTGKGGNVGAYVATELGRFSTQDAAKAAAEVHDRTRMKKGSPVRLGTLFPREIYVYQGLLGPNTTLVNEDGEDVWGVDEPWYMGVVGGLDTKLEILGLRSFAQLQEADHHPQHAFPPEMNAAVRKGTAVYFWVDPDRGVLEIGSDDELADQSWVKRWLADRIRIVRMPR